MTKVWVVLIKNYIYNDLVSVSPHLFSTEEKANTYYNNMAMMYLLHTSYHEVDTPEEIDIDKDF